MAASVVLAVDVGGTSFKAALIDAEGRMLAEGAEPTEGVLGEAAYQRLERFLRSMLDRAAPLRPVALGIISPGMEEKTGRVMFSANLGWRDLPLGARLGAALGLPVAGGHDVRTAGLAEFELGAGRGLADVAMIMIGTGIAGAFLCGGERVAGARHMACEIGHAPVYPDGEDCACGQQGCLETYASASAIVRRYRAAGGDPALTAAGILARQAEDAVAGRVCREAVEALALSLATVTLMLDPAIIVIGGGLAAAGPLLFAPLEQGLRRRLAWREPPPLVPSSLHGRGALWGAGILAFRSQRIAIAPGTWVANPPS